MTFEYNYEQVFMFLSIELATYKAKVVSLDGKTKKLLKKIVDPQLMPKFHGITLGNKIMTTLDVLGYCCALMLEKNINML